MPAERLSNTPVTIRRFDVVGIDSNEFVRHVGLALQQYDELTRSSPGVRLVHMEPPLSNDDSEREIHSFATVNLTADELHRIDVFRDLQGPEHEAEEAQEKSTYIIYPHVIKPYTDRPLLRFSCAGFVVEAYLYAGIKLIAIDYESLPKVSLEKLKEAYPDFSRELDRERLRKRFGLEGDGPWPVLLAGYVINAMARDSQAIRDESYLPKRGDEFFPSRYDDGN